MSYLREDTGVDFEFETASEASDEEGLEQFRLSNIKDRPPIFDSEALHEVLEDFTWGNAGSWVDTQVISLPCTAGNSIPDVHDDIARELEFYKNAKKAAEDAIEQFELFGVSWKRPPDYYAESVKSDDHMAKVKQQLMFEQQAIEQAEQRRKNREMKAYAKQMQAEKQKQRTKEKKDQIAQINQLRKQRADSGYQGKLELDFDGNSKRRITPDMAGQRIRADLPGKSKKRLLRDAKYGFGGRKKLQKQNTAESSADMNAMMSRRKGPSKGESRLGKKGVKGVKSGGVKKRPGKSVRQAKKSRN